MELIKNNVQMNENVENSLVSIMPKPSQAKPVAFNLFGTSFEGKDVSVADVIKEAKLDYNVSKQHLIRINDEAYNAIKDGNPMVGLQLSKDNIITSHCATVDDSTGNTLGVVGSEYGVVQNSKAFDFINFIEEVSGVTPKIETAGRLGKGERIFITAKLGEDAYLSPNDNISNYIVFTNAHDGSGAVMAFFTPIRVICQNSLNMAIKDAQNKVVFKHTKHVNTRLDWEIEANRLKALEVFSKSVKFSEEFIYRMKHLQSQRVDSEFVDDFTAQLLMQPAQFKLYLNANRNMDAVEEISTRTKNSVMALRNSIENGIGQEFDRGTKLWLINGLTTMLHNEAKWKNPEAEFESIMEGSAQKKVQMAFDLLNKAA